MRRASPSGTELYDEVKHVRLKFHDLPNPDGEAPGAVFCPEAWMCFSKARIYFNGILIDASLLDTSPDALAALLAPI